MRVSDIIDVVFASVQVTNGVIASGINLARQHGEDANLGWASLAPPVVGSKSILVSALTARPLSGHGPAGDKRSAETGSAV
jgi:hypothetical protein